MWNWKSIMPFSKRQDCAGVAPYKPRIGLYGSDLYTITLLRAALERTDVEIAAICLGGGEPERFAARLRNDPARGRFRAAIELAEDALKVNTGRIRLLRSPEGQTPDWAAAGAEIVIRCDEDTKENAQRDLEGGAKRVILTRTTQEEGVPMIVFGVNQGRLRTDTSVFACPRDELQGLAPLIKVLHGRFGVTEGFATVLRPDCEEDEACEGMETRGSGLGEALGKLFPALEGKIGSAGVRIPASPVSGVEFTGRLALPAKTEELLAAVRQAAAGGMAAQLLYCEESAPALAFRGERRPCVFESPSACVIGDRLARLRLWTDSGWSCANQTLDLCAKLSGPTA